MYLGGGWPRGEVGEGLLALVWVYDEAGGRLPSRQQQVDGSGGGWVDGSPFRAHRP